jgi:hypothetical protein
LGFAGAGDGVELGDEVVGGGEDRGVKEEVMDVFKEAGKVGCLAQPFAVGGDAVFREDELWGAIGAVAVNPVKIDGQGVFVEPGHGVGVRP